MIYFIRHTDYVKIGYTNDINRRMSDLQISCPVKIDLMALVEGDMAEESRYHEMFSNYYSHGEWFRFSKEIEDFLSNLDKSLLWKYGFLSTEEMPRGIIQYCRVKSKMTQGDLSKILGLSKRGVRDLESRCQKGMTSINNVVKALDAMGYTYEHRAVKKNP
jgi:DNA-binding transcriptional regulator YiaG